jgi:hypothetical protein
MSLATLQQLYLASLSAAGIKDACVDFASFRIKNL